MPQQLLKHIVFIPSVGMTHARPALHLCARLLTKFPNLFISFYALDFLSPQIETYLTTYHPVARQRIRVVLCPLETPPRGLIDSIARVERSFGPWIASQLADPSVEINDLVVETPSYIIDDFFNGGIALANREHHDLPIAYWWVVNAVSFLSWFGTKDYADGNRLQNAVATALSNHPETSPSKIIAKELSDRLIATPGVPPYYEHEQLTQLVGDKLHDLFCMRPRWNRVLEHLSIVVFGSVYEMEAVVAKSCAEAFPKRVSIFNSGLPVDTPKGVGQIDYTTSDQVLQFMNRAYVELGPNSVVYIAFGTIIFPPPESAVYLRVIIDEIVAQGFRVVFSVKPQYAQIAGLDEEYTSKLTEAGHAMFPEWVRQLDVLDHPATHYFLSHAGWNSITEAIVRGVPMLFWPMMGDEPVNTIHMTRQHDCGFELLQVRTGTGTAKSVAYTDHGDVPIVGSADAVRAEIHRILTLTKGVRGEQQRKNMKTLGQVAVRATEAGGSADVELERFGRAIAL